MGWARWIRTVEIVPAIDAAEAPSYERRVDVLLRTGCRIFHLKGSGADVRYALGVLAPLIHRYDGVVDVHVSDGDVSELAVSGADSVTVNLRDGAAEAVESLHAAGVQAGVAFGDADDPGAVDVPVDLVLCPALRIREFARAFGGIPLQVEEAITHENVRALYDAGATLLVAGDSIFEREDLPRAYRRLVQALA